MRFEREMIKLRTRTLYNHMVLKWFKIHASHELLMCLTHDKHVIIVCKLCVVHVMLMCLTCDVHVRLEHELIKPRTKTLWTIMWRLCFKIMLLMRCSCA